MTVSYTGTVGAEEEKDLSRLTRLRSEVSGAPSPLPEDSDLDILGA